MKTKTKKKKSKITYPLSDKRLRHLFKNVSRVELYLERADVVVLVLSKRGRRHKLKSKVAEFAAFVDTRSRVEDIIRGYGRIKVVNGSTVVGPAVPSMSHFTGDVNESFGKNYLSGTLQPGWDVDYTADFIDKHS